MGQTIFELTETPSAMALNPPEESSMNVVAMPAPAKAPRACIGGRNKNTLAYGVLRPQKAPARSSIATTATARATANTSTHKINGKISMKPTRGEEMGEEGVLVNSFSWNRLICRYSTYPARKITHTTGSGALGGVFERVQHVTDNGMEYEDI